jgi:L-alanine-DL-glutamate epimerase-like enolase superfamily enzyme
MLNLHHHFSSPINIESIHVLRWRGVDFVQSRSTDGAVVDLVQPGLVLRVANIARAGSLQITPHCPKADPNTAYMLHFAAVVPNLGPH